jgi:tetratricopeptide (TPR) repeat protein
VTAQRKSDKADVVIWTLLEGFERGIIELYKAGKYSDAISHAEALVRVSEKAFGRDDPRVGRVLIVLAFFFHDQGRYAEAEPLYRRALAIGVKAAGREPPDDAIALNNLAFLYRQQGRFTEAEQLYRRSLAIFEDALGRDYPYITDVLYNLFTNSNTKASN